jgi:hypothetical protein
MRSLRPWSPHDASTSSTSPRARIQTPRTEGKPVRGSASCGPLVSGTRSGGSASDRRISLTGTRIPSLPSIWTLFEPGNGSAASARSSGRRDPFVSCVSDILRCLSCRPGTRICRGGGAGGLPPPGTGPGGWISFGGRTPYAGLNRIRFRGSFSIPGMAGIPLAGLIEC